MNDYDFCCWCNHEFKSEYKEQIDKNPVEFYCTVEFTEKTGKKIKKYLCKECSSGILSLMEWKNENQN